MKESRSLHREVAPITYSVQHWLTTALTVLRGMKLRANVTIPWAVKPYVKPQGRGLGHLQYCICRLHAGIITIDVRNIVNCSVRVSMVTDLISIPSMEKPPYYMAAIDIYYSPVGSTIGVKIHPINQHFRGKKERSPIFIALLSFGPPKQRELALSDSACFLLRSPWSICHFFFEGFL